MKPSNTPMVEVRATNSAGQLVTYAFTEYNAAKLEYVRYCLLPWIVTVELVDLTEGSPVVLYRHPKVPSKLH